MGNPEAAETRQRSPTAIITPVIHKVKYGFQKSYRRQLMIDFHMLTIE